jgi:hypothetical protein
VVADNAPEATSAVRAATAAANASFAFGEQVSVSPDVGAALRAWVRAAVEHEATYRGLAEVLVGGTADARSPLHADCLRNAGTNRPDAELECVEVGLAKHLGKGGR